MALSKQTALNEILIRLADDGSVAGAHVVEIEHVVDMTSGDVLSSRLLPARGVTPAEVGPILGEANAGLFEQIDRLIVEKSAVTAERDALQLERNALEAERNKLKAERDALAAQLAAAPPPASPQEAFAAAIQAHVDATAKSKGYADGVAVVSYKFSTVPEWAAEAAAFVAWRDAVWLYAYSQMAAVQTGAREMPTIEQIISELPVIGW